jgi:hypothetical protein
MEGTPAEQAQRLREEYERKLSEINQRPFESATPSPELEQVPAEHQAVSETTESLIQEHVPEFKASSHQPGNHEGELAPEVRAKVQEWVNVALSDPSAGVKMAKDSQDMSLIDVFHQTLTSDVMYQEMVKRGKLPELK